ncbi:MAG: efflux RND transporter periplasmic adaptor subunit [Desulfamplus sp.]|nr:efflux RND transporter periplasmic adaptor subunit [Desulfamplus sp.]
MRQIFRWIIVILIVVVAVFGALTALRRAKQNIANAPVWQPRPSFVETDLVKEDTLSQTIHYLARLEAVSTAEISSKISARIVSLHADKGDTVLEGNLLAQLDDRDIQSQVSAIKANIEAVKYKLKGTKAAASTSLSNKSYAEKEYNRDKRLFEQKGISQSDIDASRNRLNDAQGKAIQAEQSIQSIEQEILALNSQLNEALTRLTYAQIRADSSGTIKKRFAEVGDMTMPGKPIFEMMDISSYRLAFDLVQEDLKVVAAGKKVKIDWYLPVELNSAKEVSISRIFPSLESDQTVRAEIDLLCSCPKELKVGSLVPIEVVVLEGKGLVVPQTALVPTVEEFQNMVYLLKENRLKQVKVRVKLQNDSHAIIEPVKVGEITDNDLVAVGEYLQWVRIHKDMEVYK